ncbi:MAG: hypothetical protein ABIB04_03455 [Patescibacteria group bacterium]
MNLQGRTEMSLQDQARQKFLDLLGLPGPFGPDTLFSMLVCNLYEKADFHGRLRGLDDFYGLSDSQASMAIQLMSHLQIDPVDPGIPLRPPADPRD